jgi:hypothetical protein
MCQFKLMNNLELGVSEQNKRRQVFFQRLLLHGRQLASAVAAKR